MGKKENYKLRNERKKWVRKTMDKSAETQWRMQAVMSGLGQKIRLTVLLLLHSAGVAAARILNNNRKYFFSFGERGFLSNILRRWIISITYLLPVSPLLHNTLIGSPVTHSPWCCHANRLVFLTPKAPQSNVVMFCKTSYSTWPDDDGWSSKFETFCLLEQIIMKTIRL